MNELNFLILKIRMNRTAIEMAIDLTVEIENNDDIGNSYLMNRIEIEMDLESDDEIGMYEAKSKTRFKSNIDN